MAHDHGCRLLDLENLGARRIVVPLRHPAERLASGVKNGLMSGKAWLRRARGRGGWLSGQPESRYTRALVAHMRTARRAEPASPFVRPTTWWVSGMRRASARRNVSVAFLCTCRLSADFAAALQRWGAAPVLPAPTHNSSGEYPQEPLSPDELAWVEAAYASDVQLVRKHCSPEHCAPH